MQEWIDRGHGIGRGGGIAANELMTQRIHLVRRRDFARDEEAAGLPQRIASAQVADQRGERDGEQPAEDDRQKPEEIARREPPGHSADNQTEQGR